MSEEVWCGCDGEGLAHKPGANGFRCSVKNALECADDWNERSHGEVCDSLVVLAAEVRRLQVQVQELACESSEWAFKAGVATGERDKLKAQVAAATHALEYIVRVKNWPFSHELHKVQALAKQALSSSPGGKE